MPGKNISLIYVLTVQKVRVLGNTLGIKLAIDYFEFTFVMAEDIGYDFDRVHLQNAIYIPVAHGTNEFR